MTTPDAMKLLVVLVLGMASRTPARAEPSQELHPSWSPSGDRLVFESDRSGSADLYVIELASARVRRLTDGPATDARPVWSPDGRWIAFHSNRSGNYDLYLVRPDGTGLRRLTDSDLDETNAGWDPTSRTLVYEIRRDGHWCLGVVDVASGRSRVLLDGPGDHLTPAWLTAEEIVFSYSPPGGNHDTDLVLRTTDREGSVTGELLGGLRGNSNANYSPARRRLVFNSIRDGNWEIYTAARDGRDSRRLTRQGLPELAGIDGQPEWSPSGRQIAITSGRAGSLDIVLIRPGGGEIRNLTRSWQKEPAGAAGGPGPE